MICEGVQTRYNELTSGYFRQGLHVFFLKTKKKYKLIFKKYFAIFYKILLVLMYT
jgi:hypothetical protein